MKTLVTILTVSVVLIGQTLLAQPHAVPHNALICWYPLNTTANDSTGNYSPIILEQAPFQADGGVYANGIDVPTDPNRTRIQTPFFPIYLFNGFTLSVKFKVDDVPPLGFRNYRPVLIGGRIGRWIAIMLYADTTIGMLYNGKLQPSLLHYSLNVWHEATMTYDSAAGLGAVYLDGVLACSTAFTINHGGPADRSFSAMDDAWGLPYKGYLKDLKVYVDSASLLSAPEPITAEPHTLALSQNYPNPVHGSTAIDFTLPASASVTLAVYNSLGQCVATPLNDFLSAGKHSVAWNADGLPPGVYTYRLTAGERTEARMMAVRK